MLLSNQRCGRLQGSAVCRHWYHWRLLAKERSAPNWVALSPPWPVTRLACRMKGTSPILAALLSPFALLACLEDDQADLLAINHEPRVKSGARSAKFFRSIGIGPSSP